MSAPTPLLDFFKRGEVDRDVRMLAAEGALAPRAHEQLAILVLLLEDRDRGDPRRRPTRRIARIPEASLRAFLARSDVPVDLREFFADRGIFPDEIPPIEFEAEVDEPLIDTDPVADAAEDEDDEEARKSGVQALATMTFPAAAQGGDEGHARDARGADPRSRTS